jgi:hypothetical protein
LRFPQFAAGRPPRCQSFVVSHEALTLVPAYRALGAG